MPSRNGWKWGCLGLLEFSVSSNLRAGHWGLVGLYKGLIWIRLYLLTRNYVYFLFSKELLLFVEDAWSGIQCTGTVICRLVFVGKGSLTLLILGNMMD
ncbi:hypothetical protein PEX1_021420 [Penicillium expansum]|uniref:Uncharacterized protein n=1 Tax=Penicillium expansum TaxID=27334 RepID=A0A0A2K034_PENEN|nr:hypothetical protein PEX2_022230 [Penicillium expansum]KGO48349.1 hypothetical protein PEX1_021420 [Penicillium expansum]KGO49082.1 hypothetical protein PEXP_011310 [Penicillium expansum]KGO57780.1 hypothetical protein PEX2_022230 [Penicillium expansum]